MDAKVNLEFGNLHPLDESAGDSSDFAHSAARGIAAMLQDNPAMAALLEAMDETMRADLVSGMADIIREAQAAEGESAPAPDVAAEE
jgi:hypothetical protein